VQATEAARPAFIGLGANLGDAQQTLTQALAQLDTSAGVQVMAVSPFYRSAPVQAEGPDFINAVAQVRTTLTPLELLDVLQAIEQAHLRQRPYRNAPRTLDLDLLWHDARVISSARLVLPHPRMHERAFVLAPLLDLAPAWTLPQGDLPTLLAACTGQAIERLDT